MSVLQAAHHICQGCIPEQLSAVHVLHTAIVGSEGSEVAATDCQAEESHNLFLVSMRQIPMSMPPTWSWLVMTAMICSATRALIWGLSSIALTRRVVVHRGDGRTARFASASHRSMGGGTIQSSGNGYNGIEGRLLIELVESQFDIRHVCFGAVSLNR